MAFQTDVLATKPLTSTGNFLDQNGGVVGRTRIKSIYAVNAASAGSVVIRNGSTGKILITVDTPASATAGFTILPLPGEGILADDALHGTITDVTSVVVVYG